jgi:hypothetical protein
LNSRAVDALIEKARAAAAKLLYECDHGRKLHPDVAVRCWQTYIQPILDYGVAIWGVSISSAAAKRLEAVQADFGRDLLGCGPTAATSFVRGELGLISQQARRDEACLRFWYRLRHVDCKRLLFRVFCRRSQDSGRGEAALSWCHGARDVFERYGLQDFFDGRRKLDEDGHVVDWRQLVREAVRTRDLALWREDVADKSTLQLYARITRAPAVAAYLHSPHREAVGVMSRARAGCLPVMQRIAEWARLPPSAARCLMCDGGVVEDVEHMLLECPAMATERARFVSGLRARLAPYMPAPEVECLLQRMDDNDAAITIVLGELPDECMRISITSDRQAHTRRQHAATALATAAMLYATACWRHRVQRCGKLHVTHRREGPLIIHTPP